MPQKNLVALPLITITLIHLIAGDKLKHTIVTISRLLSRRPKEIENGQ